MRFFLLTSTEKPNPCKPPLLLDFLNHNESPVVVAQQWLSFLASEESNALRPRLLWQAGGATSWGEFVAARPDLAELFTAGLYFVAGALHAKLSAEIAKANPWRACSVVDERIPLPTRLAIGAESIRNHMCCVGATVKGIVQNQNIVLPQDWMKPAAQQCVKGLVTAAQQIMSVVDIERLHIRSKTLKTTKGP